MLVELTSLCFSNVRSHCGNLRRDNSQQKILYVQALPALLALLALIGQ
ncbi:hypothetical protein SF123566_6474 [Shigella flexneri 1235-66]|nr:hypothetical protein SF123566_6474 [Shigella flexneri 1235-66]